MSSIKREIRYFSVVVVCDGIEMYKNAWRVVVLPIQLFWPFGYRRRRGILKSLISSGSNPSTHFHVKTPGTQNVGILKLLTSLITFRHFHNEKREDALKSFRSSGRMDKESSIRVFFPFIWVKRTAYYAWKVMQRRMSLKHWQQNRASCLATLCCKMSWKVRLRGLSPTFKLVLQQVSCVKTNLSLGNFTRESSTFGRHLVFDVLFNERRDCPLKASINSLSS